MRKKAIPKQKGPLFSTLWDFLLFSALWDCSKFWFYSQIFKNCSPINFWYFATEWRFKKSQRVPLFTFFGTMRLTGNFKKIQKNSDFFSSIFSFLRAFVVSSCRKSGFRVFLRVRYGADLGRSRLVMIEMQRGNKQLRNKERKRSGNCI